MEKNNYQSLNNGSQYPPEMAITGHHKWVTPRLRGTEEPTRSVQLHAHARAFKKSQLTNQ